MPKDLVSIVVVTWNACDYTRYCIDSVRRYTSYPYRLTVVDNGSTDGTLAYLESQRDIHVIANNENLGYGGAIIQGYNAEPTRFVCVMNNDIVVSPGWLETMTQAMGENPRIGLLGTLRPASFCLHPSGLRNTGLVLRDTKEVQLPNPAEWLERFCHPLSYKDYVDEVKKVNNFGFRMVEGPPSFVSTCCVLVNREIIDQVGGLADSRFFRYGCEDVDLCWRISTAGYEVAITSDVYIHHFKHISVEASNLDIKRFTEENMRIFYTKWREEIDRFLSAKKLEGVDVRNRLVEEDSEYWFLARLEKIVGTEFFWNSIEGSNYGKERR